MLRFANTQEEMVFWKHKYETMEKELSYWKNKCEEIEQEFEDYRQNSQMLERELEASLEQTEKANRELRTKNNRLHLDNETLREKYEVENQNFISQINELQDESKRCHTREENYVKYIRELEQKNDDLERSLRATYVSLAEFETKLNSAIEQNALLESELVDKEELKAMVQRLKDETRDLKQEIQVKERELQPDNDKVAASRRCTSFRVSSAKNTHNHDSKRLSCSNADSPLKSQTHVKSLSSGHPVLNTPTRISAMNIVGDLLRKVGALESKLANCRISPNNSHESLSNLDNGHADDIILDNDFLSECDDGLHDVASDYENNVCKRKMENGNRTPVKEVPSITITPTNRDERISHEVQSVSIKSKLPVWRGTQRCCPVNVDSNVRQKNSSPVTTKPGTGDVQVGDDNSGEIQSIVATPNSVKSRVVKKSLYSDKSNSSSCSSSSFGGTDSRTASKKWVYCSKVDRSTYDCGSLKLKRTCVAPTKKFSFKVCSDSSSADASIDKNDNTAPAEKQLPNSVVSKSTSAGKVNENDLSIVKSVSANSSSMTVSKVHSDCVSVLENEPEAIIVNPEIGLANSIQSRNIGIDLNRQQPLKKNDADDGNKLNYYYYDLELSNRTKRLFDDFELSTSRYIMELDSMFDQSPKSSSDDDSEKNGFVNPLFSYKKSIANYGKQKRSTSNIDKASVEIIKHFLSHTKSADDTKIINDTDALDQAQLECVPVQIDLNSNNNNNKDDGRSGDNNNNTDVASSVNDQLLSAVQNKNKSESPYTSISAIHRVTEIVQNIGSVDCKKSVSVAKKSFAKNAEKGSLRHSGNKINTATVVTKEKQEKQQNDKSSKCERFAKKTQVESKGSLKKIDKKLNSTPFDKTPLKCIQSSSSSSIPVKCSRYRKVFGDSATFVSDENEKKKADITNRQKSSGLPLALLSGNIQPFYLARKNGGPPKEESPTNRISRLFVDKGNSGSTKSQETFSYAQSNSRQQRPSKAVFSCSKNRLNDRKNSLLQNADSSTKRTENDLPQSKNSTKCTQNGALKSSNVEKRVQTGRFTDEKRLNDGNISPVGNRRYTYIIYRDDENSTSEENKKHALVGSSVPEVMKLKRESTFMTNSINEKTTVISYNIPKVDPLS